MAHAERTGSSNTGVVAIVAIVLLVMMGFFFFRGGFGRRGGGQVDTPGVKGSIELNAPKPSAPAAPSPGQ